MRFSHDATSESRSETGFYVNTGNRSSTGKNSLGSVTEVVAKNNVPETALLVSGKSIEQRTSATFSEPSASGKAADAVELKAIDRSEWIHNHIITSVLKQKGFNITEVKMIYFGMDIYQENTKIIGRLADDYFYLNIQARPDPEGMGSDTIEVTSKHADNIGSLLKSLDNDALNINLPKGSKSREQVRDHLLKLLDEYSLQDNLLKVPKSLSVDVREKSPHKDEIIKGKEIINNNPSLGLLEVDKRTLYGPVGKKTITLNPSLEIIDPSELLLAVEADYYKSKYGINIKIVISDDIQYSLCTLMEKEKLDDKSAMGIILGVRRSRHLTPIIISKQANTTYFIISDGIDDPNRVEVMLCYIAQKINNESGKENFTVVSAYFSRQTDEHSCRNDAILFLKDALNRQKEFVEYLENSFINCERYLMEKEPFKYYAAKIPPFLYKTVQRKVTLDALTSDQLQTPLKKPVPLSGKGKIKTIKTHFDKYIYPVHATVVDSKENAAVKLWQVNTYLQTKPYHLLNRAFKRLANDNGQIDPEKEQQLMAEYVIRN